MFNLKKDKFIPGKTRIEYGGAIVDKLEREAMLKVFDSQGGKRWTIGPESEAFERELADFMNVKRAVVVNSGSSALLVTMTALHLKKGSMVIVPALNFPTAFNAIIQCGLVPLVVDIDPNTMNLSLIGVKEAISKHGENISAVIAVNIASNPVNLIKLRRLIGKTRKIILDNCDGFSTKINGKYVEEYADISCVSFHAAHILTTGEGGACLTNDEELADRCRKIREWGRASGTDNLYKYPGLPEDYRERYVYEEIGYNLKPLELQCAIGRVQLKKVNGFRERRIENFKLLYDGFKQFSKIKLVHWMPEAEICWFSFPFFCTKVPRKLVMDTLETNNIECRTIFSGNILRHPAYKDIKYEVANEKGFPNADFVMEKGVFISVHPSITKEMIKFIVDVVGGLAK